MSERLDLSLDLDKMRQPVADALREHVDRGHPRPTLNQLQKLLPRLRVHAAVLLPIIEGRLRKTSPDGPRRGETTLKSSAAEVRRVRS